MSGNGDVKRFDWGGSQVRQAQAGQRGTLSKQAKWQSIKEPNPRMPRTPSPSDPSGRTPFGEGQSGQVKVHMPPSQHQLLGPARAPDAVQKMMTHAQGGYQAAHRAMEAFHQGGGNLAALHSHGRLLQQHIKALKAAGARPEELKSMRQHLIALSGAVQGGDHARAHESILGLQHAFWKHHSAISAEHTGQPQPLSMASGVGAQPSATPSQAAGRPSPPSGRAGSPSKPDPGLMEHVNRGIQYIGGAAIDAWQGLRKGLAKVYHKDYKPGVNYFSDRGCRLHKQAGDWFVDGTPMTPDTSDRVVELLYGKLWTVEMDARLASDSFDELPKKHNAEDFDKAIKAAGNIKVESWDHRFVNNDDLVPSENKVPDDELVKKVKHDHRAVPPIVVRPGEGVDKNKYIILDGHHRAAALKKAGQSGSWAVVVKKGTYARDNGQPICFKAEEPPPPDTRTEMAKFADGITVLAKAIAGRPPVVIQNRIEPTPLTVKNQVNPTPVTVENKVEPTPITVENKVNPTPVTVENKVSPTPIHVDNKVEVKKSGTTVTDVEYKRASDGGAIIGARVTKKET